MGDATRRGRVTGPGAGTAARRPWSPSPVRALETGGRVAVDLAPPPDLYADVSG